MAVGLSASSLAFGAGHEGSYSIMAILVGRRMAPGVLADGAVRGGAGVERLAGPQAALQILKRT